MKKNDFVQIKGLDIKELKAKAKDIKKDIANLVLDKNMKKTKDLKAVSKIRKDLAQVLTVIKQKELLGELESRVKSLESSKKAEAPYPEDDQPVADKVEKGKSK